jgi:Transposase DDE domain
VIDGSEVGHQCITLMISLIYGKRALPITWLVVKGCKGHLSEKVHLELLTQLHAILPENCRMVFIGDGEFDGIELQAALQTKGWQYVCRTAKNTQKDKTVGIYTILETWQKSSVIVFRFGQEFGHYRKPGYRRSVKRLRQSVSGYAYPNGSAV